jgi:microcystin-dependent protein
MKKLVFSHAFVWCLSLFLTSEIFAQNVGINDDNSTPDPNAVLDVKSTSKGVLFPRMTTAQRTTLGAANPTEGMLVFDTEVETFFYFVNGDWVALSTGAGSGVPVGTILPYAGTVSDDGMVVEPIPGYLLCNGAEITSLQYPSLKTTLSTAWGDGDDTDLNTVNLPDLRGMFLRGVSGPRTDGKQDPDASGRSVMLPGGNTGDNVGTYQEDVFGSHNHGGGDHNHSGIQKRADTESSSSLSGTGQSLWEGLSGSNTTAYSGAIISYQGGSETRSKNANVYYIIKY